MANFELVAQVGAVTEALQAQPDIVEQMIVGRMNALHAELEARISANLSGGVLETRTGKLLSTVNTQPAVVGPEILQATTTAGGDDAPYGIFHEFGGIGFYTIRPVNAKVLAFMQGGSTVFAMSVNHPPLPQRPWFEPAAEEMMPKMQAELIETYQTAFIGA